MRSLSNSGLAAEAAAPRPAGKIMAPARGHGVVAPADELVPVAAYVRMSTDHQQYSTQNQLDRIHDYARQREMSVVRVFADEGKSGLNLNGRDGLRSLIAAVETGTAEFKCILVYDVSRWGRFQDADES